MSDRLKDLQRQRALAQEQLAWLDREIARETSGTATVPSVPAPHVPQPGVPVVPQSPAPSTADADDIIAQYQQQPETVHGEVKRGCFLYFFLALATVGLVVLGLYLSRRH
jgi:hypothetical protein